MFGTSKITPYGCQNNVSFPAMALTYAEWKINHGDEVTTLERVTDHVYAFECKGSAHIYNALTRQLKSYRFNNTVRV